MTHEEFTIIYEDWTNVTRHRENPLIGHNVFQLGREVRERHDLVAEYCLLNMAVVRCRVDELRWLQDRPGFAAIMKFDHPIERYAKVLKALDAIHNQAMFQSYEWFEDRNKGIAFPNERYEGGISPAGKYPKFSAKFGWTTEDRAIECMPAWMPVINLSISTSPEEPYSPMNFALDRLASTHLIVVAAGNEHHAVLVPTISGFAPDWDYPGIICVGATADEEGKKLASYSSTGTVDNPNRRPCVVAYGKSALNDQSEGTSFAAPRVASIACLCFDAIFQVASLAAEVRSNDAIRGVPLVGFGMVDDLQDSVESACARLALSAMPFLAIRRNEVRERFKRLHAIGLQPNFSIHGAPVKKLILQSARQMPGYGAHEVGEGFVSESQFINCLATLDLATILQLFCDNVKASEIPGWTQGVMVFDKDELFELARIGSAARPIWTYDFNRGKFFVNRKHGDGRMVSLPDHGNFHAHEVAYTGRFGYDKNRQSR